MKNIFSLLAVSALLISQHSCKSSGTKDAASRHSDSVKANAAFVLEELLNIKDEAALKAKFGATHVRYDTIWGPEGSFELGSYLDQGTKDEVEILWKDSLHRSGMSYAAISGDGGNKWTSKSGVKLGATTDELEKLNGKPFSFSGFGWDYGGGVMGWNDGKLDKEGVGVLLEEGDKAADLPDDESSQIYGDQEVKSDNPVVKKVQPHVARLSVYIPD